jgi:two-component system chemotaxis response regulator CheB
VPASAAPNLEGPLRWSAGHTAPTSESPLDTTTKVMQESSSPSPSPTPVPERPARSGRDVSHLTRTSHARLSGLPELLVIGVSTGGPDALANVVPFFPKEMPVPVLVVQHMPPMFTKLLAGRLGNLCPLSCAEAQEGEEVGPGKLRLAPGNFHMTVARKENRFVLHLNQDAPENSCRPAVDVLFRHAAACAGGRVLSVVLTGMGQDGLKGAEKIHAAGGSVIVQDESSSVVWGMPGAIAHAGLADVVLPLSEIGEEIMKRLRGGKR